jgi:hypothetical protein
MLEKYKDRLGSRTGWEEKDIIEMTKYKDRHSSHVIKTIWS